jgi:hypothetical protein
MAAFALAGGLHYLGLSQLQAFRPAMVTDVLLGPRWAAGGQRTNPEADSTRTGSDGQDSSNVDDDELRQKVRKDKGWPKWLPFRRLGEGELEEKMVAQLEQVERELKEQQEKMEREQVDSEKLERELNEQHTASLDQHRN